MKHQYFITRFTLIGLLLMASACTTTIKNEVAIAQFTQEMSAKHGFEPKALADIFDQVAIKPEIIKKISSPAEGLPWYKYRKLFLTQKRISAGVEFWRNNQAALNRAEQIYGVPAAIIVAILGVETSYGKHTGNYRVIDALSTLAFAYPPRSPFFRTELENFLLLCQQEQLNPLIPTGSYAGAMGMPQFMPSSYRNYAVDFTNDNKRDIWQNPDDTVASIANYFVEHGWQPGKNVSAPFRDAVHKTSENLNFLKEDLRKPDVQSSQLKQRTPVLSSPKARIIAFELEKGEELWVTSDNFYVITRYNKSPLYAMAVFQLSLALSNQIKFSYEQNHNDTTYPTGIRLRE
jgi:membrane-bound lytic murein transglycosylase B